MQNDLFALTQNALTRSRQLRDEAIELRLNLLDVRSPDAGLDELVEAVVRLARADRGNLQVFDPESGTLRMVAQMGFDEPFLEFFAEVDSRRSACGVAFATREPVVVEDVCQSRIYSDPEALRVMLDAEVRAIESAPLAGTNGEAFGAISVHYAEPLASTGHVGGRLGPIATVIGPRVQAALTNGHPPGPPRPAVVWLD
jgi:GAF domain-containing protein